MTPNDNREADMQALASDVEQQKTPEHDGPQEASPCSKVFAIPELAEQILLDLSMQDLLCGAQQVCRQWKQAVRNSDHVQEHLFMKPICSDKRLYYVQKALTKTENYSLCHWADLQHPRHQRTVLENPFLILLCHEDMRTECFLRAEASWRRMQVAQPPIGEVEVLLGSERTRTVRSTDRSGVLLSDIESSDFLLGIYGWFEWTPYTDLKQIKAAKVELRSDCMCEDEEVEVFEDDVWWMPDEHLYGL